MANEKKESLKDILSALNTEINTLSQNLDPSQKTKLSKIGGLFKTQKSTVAQTTQLRRHWNKLMASLKDEANLSALLQSAKMQMEQEAASLEEKGVEGLIATYRPWEEEGSRRIFKIVQGYFDGVSSGTAKQAENNYPNTLYHLFDLAEKIVKGEYGEKIKNNFLHFSPTASPWKNVVALLMVNFSRIPASEKTQDANPELFAAFNNDQRWLNLLQLLPTLSPWQIEDLILATPLDPLTSLCKSGVGDFLGRIDADPQTLKAIMQIFDRFIANLVNPSSVLIQLLLQMKMPQKAIQKASLIKNDFERSKAYSDIMDRLADGKQFTQAAELWFEINTKADKSRSAVKLTQKMIEAGCINEAVHFAQRMDDIDEKEHLLREIAIQLAKQKSTDKAMEITSMIQDPDRQAYTLSNVVMILAHQHQYQKAKELAFKIKDRGFREDAINDIVKSYLQIRQIDEAIKFVDSIANPHEKIKPAKIIESALKSYHQDVKVRNVRKIFSLMRVPLRPAA